MRGKYVGCLFLVLALAPIASADPVTGFGPFTARAHGTAIAHVVLQPDNPLSPFSGDHPIDVNISVHRNSPNGTVQDDTQGSITLHDQVTGTMIARIAIGVALLSRYPLPNPNAIPPYPGGSYQGLVLTGQAKVNDSLLDASGGAAYTVILGQGASPNFSLSISSPTFLLSYVATLDTVEVTPG
jgi:hypothetical protein